MDTAHHLQISSESDFTRGNVCSVATPAGRVTVTDDRLIVTEAGVKHEMPLADATARCAALKRYCNIVL